MLALAFLAQLQQRFSHEKRARVSVRFDPQEDFRRLLAVFHAHLAKSAPQAVHLLAYDPKAKKAALTAVMYKLVILLNQLLKQPEYPLA